MAFAAGLAAGCAASHTTVVKPSGAPVQLQTATKPELIARYNQQAEAVTSLNMTVTMTLTAGSAYTGVIKQYHEVKGFILAQKPSTIRVIPRRSSTYRWPAKRVSRNSAIGRSVLSSIKAR